MATETTWTPIRFGTHKGKTLPQIVLSDPDWFFWAVGNNVFRDEFKEEAEDIAYKACFIKIPKPDPENWRVEYQFNRDGQFVDFGIIDLNTASAIASSMEISHYLDLSVPRRRNYYDKLGSQLMLSRFRNYYFEGKNLSKDRCEDFFNRESNFVWVCELPNDDTIDGSWIVVDFENEHQRCTGNTCQL